MVKTPETPRMNNTEPLDEHDGTLDPTINVQNLLRAAVVRIDDLRAAETRRVEESINSEAIRLNESIAAERRRVDEQMELRVYYDTLLRDAEAKRIDAIRVVDVNNTAIDRERAAAQATVLANQVAASADTLRALVATTAASVAASLSAVTQQFTDRLAILERASYEGKGKEAASDPMLATLAAKVDTLQTAVTLSGGKGAGRNDMWGFIVGGAGLLALVLKALNVY